MASRFSTLGRDLDAVFWAFTGRRPSPASQRDGAWYTSRSDQGGGLRRRRLRVVAVEPVAEDAVCVTLTDPSGGPIPFAPGQFLTVEVGGKRRAYSLCSDPARPEQVSVGVRAVPGGAVSGALVNGLAVGQELDVLGPSGSYGLRPEPSARRRVVLVSGGSGITPHLAVLEGLLRQEPASSAVLVYGNRTVASTMFRSRVEALQAEFPERLRVVWVVEQAAPGWSGRVGRLDEAGLAEALSGVDLASVDAFLLCGPEPVLQAGERLLGRAGVAANRVQVERFRPAPARSVGAQGPVWARVLGRRVWVEPRQSLLEAAVAAGVPLAWSCAVGGCGACKVRLVEGEVAMDEPNCLGPTERGEGWILACVTHPLTSCVVERA